MTSCPRRAAKVRHPIPIPDRVSSAAIDDPAVGSVAQLNVRFARDVMTVNPERVACGDSLSEVARVMRSLLVAFLPVCDENGDLYGIIALRDLHRAVRDSDPASSLAQQPAVTIGVDDTVHRVRALMAELRMWLLPVLDGRRLAGIIRYAADPSARTRWGSHPVATRPPPAVP